MDALLANWNSKQLCVLLLLCGLAGLISTICTTYSFRVDEADQPSAINSRIRGTISLIATLALLAAAAWVYWRAPGPQHVLGKTASAATFAEGS